MCRFHGGGAPQVKDAGKRRQEGERARQAVAVYGLPRDVDPHDALLEEVRRTAGHIAMLEDVVAGLERDRLVFSTSSVDDPEGRPITVAVAYSVWLQLYQAERKHLLAACKTAIRCGVEERRVELEERQGALIADVFRAVFNDPALGLDEQQRKTALTSTARHLRAIPGGGAA